MSKLPFELLLALRYLRPKRTFVSIITIISVLGVMLGVAVLIIVISVMSGFDHDLREKVLGFNAHLRVATADGSILKNYAQVMSMVSSNRSVRGVTPYCIEQVLIKSQPRNGQPQVLGQMVRGVDEKLEGSVTKLPSSLVDGTFDLSERGMLVGTALVEKMSLRVGDHVSVYSPADLEKMEEAHRKGIERAVLPKDFEVRGIFDTGLNDFNSLFVITSLEEAQKLYNLYDDDGVHGLMVAIEDPFEASRVAHELETSLGTEFNVTTFIEDSPLMAAVMVEKNVMLYILFFIIIVAAFGITCTLITFIMMKTREIGVMKALGATNAQVMRVFLGQSLIVSVLGVLAGVGLGVLAITYRNEFLSFMRRTTGMELFPQNIYQFSQLPALVLPGDLAIICGGSLVICLIAAALPAWHASKLNPVEALRHE